MSGEQVLFIPSINSETSEFVDVERLPVSSDSLLLEDDRLPVFDADGYIADQEEGREDDQTDQCQQEVYKPLHDMIFFRVRKMIFRYSLTQ